MMQCPNCKAVVTPIIEGHDDKNNITEYYCGRCDTRIVLTYTKEFNIEDSIDKDDLPF